MWNGKNVRCNLVHYNEHLLIFLCNHFGRWNGELTSAWRVTSRPHLSVIVEGKKKERRRGKIKIYKIGRLKKKLVWKYKMLLRQFKLPIPFSKKKKNVKLPTYLSNKKIKIRKNKRNMISNEIFSPFGSRVNWITYVFCLPKLLVYLFENCSVLSSYCCFFSSAKGFCEIRVRRYLFWKVCSIGDVLAWFLFQNLKTR